MASLEDKAIWEDGQVNRVKTTYLHGCIIRRFSFEICDRFLCELRYLPVFFCYFKSILLISLSHLSSLLSCQQCAWY